jgi:hypothetical protein
MLETKRFVPEHLKGITPQPEQAAEWAAAVQDTPRGDGWTVLVDGKPIACAVLVQTSMSRAAVYAFIGADAGPYMRAVYRTAARMFDMHPYSRIEALVIEGFAAGARWMEMLDFELETPNGMKSFGPNGETYMLYARTW